MTPVSDLPSFKGRPVPWITRWTEETSKERYSYQTSVNKDGLLRIAYTDGKENREGDLLWQREGINRQGVPEFKVVSTYRQRSALRKCLCQVCGKKITDRPIPWLVPILEGTIEYVDDDTPITIQAPTCTECVDLALKLCPHLKAQGYQLLMVEDYELWGVFGQVSAFSGGGRPTKFQSAVCYDTTMYGPDFTLAQVLAQQEVAKLGKFTVEREYRP